MNNQLKSRAFAPYIVMICRSYFPTNRFRLLRNKEKQTDCMSTMGVGDKILRRTVQDSNLESKETIEAFADKLFVPGDCQ